ncbi:MAG: leucine-rich repeat domain-containing protein [Lachnospiraceae bacterium]|nr:leucine-rich repeat domain-containing protein [Lachnospiraceae bacterium]
MEKKNKIGRNILIWAVAMVMAILLAGFNGMESKAADTYTYQVAGQSWTYTVDDKNQVTITGYSGTSENVVIPGNIDGKTVTAIGTSAFSRCTSMKNITIPVTVTSIGSNAFYSCYNLETVTIPFGVTEINNFTFSECKKLKNVTFEAGSKLESIGYQAFYNCSLTKITIPEQVNYIDTDAFYGCNQMKIQVAGGNKHYSADEKGALYNKEKTKLVLCPYTGTDYVVADSVKTIGKYAFAYNSVMENITFPEGLETIENEAFFSCTAIETIVLPASVKSMGRNALDTHGYYPVLYYPEALDLTEADVPNDMLQVSYKINSDKTVSLIVKAVPYGYTKIDLPAYIMGMAISSLEYVSGINTSRISLKCTNHFSSDGTWEYNENKHWFTTCSVCGLGGGVREVHDFTEGTCACRCGYVPFELTTSSKDCTIIYGEECTLSVLAEATLGEEEITYQWYQNEKAIKDGVLAQYKVTTDIPTGEYTYYCKVSCGKYSINSEEMHIQIKKAANPPNMPETAMKVPYTNTKVGDISLGEGWEWMEAYKNISLKIGIGVKVTAVYKGDDKGNYENEKVSVTITRELKNGTVITDTKSKAQYKVTKSDRNGVEVQYVKPTSKTTKTIVVPTIIESEGVSCKVTSIGAKAFKNNKKITKVTIGNNVKTIGSEAFMGCKKLKTVTLGKNVTTIGSKAFYKCSVLNKITIPTKVSKIGKQAFYNCKKLKEITIKTTKLTKKNVGSKAFTGTGANVKVKVPAKKLTAYKSLLKAKGIGAKAKIAK